MLIISYDIEDDQLRNHFNRMLTKNGAIRLQYSVYEFNNTKRQTDNILLKIKNYYASRFGGGDSVLIIDATSDKIPKFGNAIHRDQDIVFL